MIPPVPVDSRRQDWPRLVSNAFKAADSALKGIAAGSSTTGDELATYQTQATGWANYADTAGAQALTANVRSVYTVNAGSKIETQKPADVTTFWNAANNTITGREGDGILVKIQSVFTPSTAAASRCLIEVDIGGAFGVVEEHKFPITDGAGVAHPLSWTFAGYTLDTWAENGGTIYITADGPGSLTAKRVVITRTHKAR